MARGQAPGQFAPPIPVHWSALNGYLLEELMNRQITGSVMERLRWLLAVGLSAPVK